MAAVVSSYAMHLAGYLDERTPNDWLTVAYLGFVCVAIVWALFGPSGGDE